MRVATLAVGLLVGSARAAAQDYVEVPVASVEMGMTEEEGGHESSVYYPSGWMQFSGHKSCCGFKPHLADGWYKLSPVAAQAFFDRVARAVALGRPAPDVEEGQGHSHHCTITFPDGKTLVCRGFPLGSGDPGVGLGEAAKPTTLKRPSDFAQRKHVGRHLRSIAVLRVLERESDDVARLSLVEIDLLLAEMIKSPSRSVADGEFVAKILGKLPDAAAGRVAAMITGPRPAGLRPAEVIRALGAHGAAARPHVGAIGAAVIDDASRVAAALALWQIGGDEALAALRSLLPRLGAPPLEKNLQIYYRLQFARALRQIELPEARAILDDKIFPVVRAHIESAGPNAMNDAGAALDVWRGHPRAPLLEEAYTKLYLQLLRSPKPDDRWMAAERLHHRFHGKLPEPLRVALEKLRADANPTVKDWAEQALKVSAP